MFVVYNLRQKQWFQTTIIFFLNFYRKRYNFHSGF